MNDKVVPLFPGQIDPEIPCLTGKCVCVSCKHEWVGISAVGEHEGLECPSCGLAKGVHIGIAYPNQAWGCGCGAMLFFITPKGALCSNCGKTQSW